MSERYFGKVVSIRDEYSVVINRGSSHDVAEGQKFLIIGLGEVIVDPDTNEELEQLEIVRGRVEAIHVQSKITTVNTCDYEQSEGTKEIKKVSASGGIVSFGAQNTVTESITPGSKYLKKISEVVVGDCVIKL